MSSDQVTESFASLEDLEEVYKSVYPGDELKLEGFNDSEYDMMISTNRTDDINFSRRLNSSEREVEEFSNGGEPNIPALTGVYSESPQKPVTKVFELSPEARGMSEEQENLWYAFTDLGEEVLDPEVCIRPNTYDCVYLFDLTC